MPPKQKIRKSNPNALPSIVSIAMVLLMVGLFLVIALSAKKLSDYLRENVVITAYLQSDGDSLAILDLQKELQAKPEIKQVIYTDKETAAKNFSEELDQDFVNALGYNPIRGSFDIVFRPEHVSQGALATMKQELLKNEVVYEAVYETHLLEQIEENIRLILTIISGLSLLFLLIAVTLINSTIRLDLYSRRFLIRSMQLVGATRWFIIRPFVWKAMINGFFGWLLAVLMMGGLFYLIYKWVPGVGEILSIQEMSLIGAFIFIFGIFLTMICSFFATRKYLKLKLEELY
jgi:cell division transport system permease protein